MGPQEELARELESQAARRALHERDAALATRFREHCRGQSSDVARRGSFPEGRMGDCAPQLIECSHLDGGL